MRINEIFYSLQGEGANVGRASIFIRLSKCNLRCSFCDTEFDSGYNMSLSELYDKIKNYPSRFIIWTGGEPTLQLNEQSVSFFKDKGYTQAIETNGTRPVPRGIDYITCSPKIDDVEVLHKNFPNGVNEFRYPLSSNGLLPPPIGELPKAENYFVSPIFVGDESMTLDRKALDMCIDFVQNNPSWRLSMQLHKLINIQ